MKNFLFEASKNGLKPIKNYQKMHLFSDFGQPPTF